MARATSRIVITGTNLLCGALDNIVEALDNAKAEGLHIEISECSEPMGVTANGIRIASFSELKFEPDAIVCRLEPELGMVTFIGWLMLHLPSRATVTWVDGWPHVHCPPNDDQDAEDDPSPLVPDELVPA